MAETALRRMTVREFLEWSDGTDRRYELIDGEPALMAPPRAWHRRSLVNLGWVFRERLKGPFVAEAEAGIQVPHRANSYYVADLAVAATGPETNEQWTPAPIVIIEILSPETARHDRQRKQPDYACLPSVEEIALVSTDRRSIELWRRSAGGTWPTQPVLCSDRLIFQAIDVVVSLDEVYRDTGL